jgi:glycosyltransferase involved in cell wall biosynthesis
VHASGRKRLKVLVGAYACSPARGSECGVGWGWVEAVSKYHDLWVLTGNQYQEEIEVELSRRPELRGHVHFHYIPRFRATTLERFWEPAYLWTYKHQWQRDAYRIARKLQAEIGFDLVHQITYVGFRVPGYLWKLGIPFVWGPLGGLEQMPWRLLPALEWRGRIHFFCRNLWNEFDRRCGPTPARAFRKAAAVIAATRGMQSQIQRFYRRDSTVICEIGLPPSAVNEPRMRRATEPLKLLWSGLHNPGKALPVLLRALALLPKHVDWRLAVLGDGPSSGKWKRLCRDLGLALRCEWFGQVPRRQALTEMQSAHVFVITSLHDLTSTVLIEALANGLPVVCPDLCGFRDAVTPECGVLVSARTASGLVEGMSRAILELHDCEPLRYRMAAAAIKRSDLYSWETKAEAVDRIYHSVVEAARFPARI